VLVTLQLEPKLTDFGLSRFNNKETPDANKTDSFVGPLRWMAPECITEQRYGTKSDVWAFSVFLIEVFTRGVPFPDMQPLAVSAAVAARKIIPKIPEPFYSQTPPIIHTIMQESTMWEPAQRPDMVKIVKLLGQHLT
jgi:serine/threonine protein kinase